MSKSSELDRVVKLYILNSVSDQADTLIINDIITYIKDRFNNEMNWRIDQAGQQTAMIDWLQGLSLNIEYNNHDILDLAVKWGSIGSNASEKKKQKILDHYWRFMSAKTLQLISGYRLPKGDQL